MTLKNSSLGQQLLQKESKRSRPRKTGTIQRKKFNQRRITNLIIKKNRKSMNVIDSNFFKTSDNKKRASQKNLIKKNLTFFFFPPK